MKGSGGANDGVGETDSWMDGWVEEERVVEGEGERREGEGRAERVGGDTG